MAATPEEVTQLLQSWGQGQREALDKLVPLVYAELHRLAQGYMGGEREGHLLQTTALINEAFLRLINWKNVSWQSRAHFFGVSAQLMRRILVDFARSNKARRGVVKSSVSLGADLSPAGSSPDVVAVDEALNSLEALDQRKGKIVELRFFGGLSAKETAEFLKISSRTVEREWSLAQAWLLRELGRARSK